MKMLIAVSGSGMLVGGLYAGDALTPGEVYPMPISQAAGELAQMPIPALLAQATSGTDAAEVEVRRTDRSIGWHFRVRGQEFSAFTARLTPEGPSRTRVVVHFSPGEALSPEIAGLASARLTRSLAEIAMSEQVDAALEHRPVDQDRTMRALARHIADHPEQVQEYGLEVEGIFQEIGNRAAETAHGPARPIEPIINQSAMDAATRPSVVLPVN